MCNRIKKYEENDSNYLISNLTNQLNQIQNENTSISNISNKIQCKNNLSKIEYERMIEYFNSIQRN
jgi:hypothetical protein